MRDQLLENEQSGPLGTQKFVTSEARLIFLVLDFLLLKCIHNSWYNEQMQQQYFCDRICESPAYRENMQVA